MHLHVRHHDDAWDVDVHLTDPEATIADLTAALDPGSVPRAVRIDGTVTAPATPVHRSRLRGGATVDLGPVDPREREGDGAWAVVIAGLDIGRRVPLDPDGTILGRQPDATGGTTPRRTALLDPTVSARHAHIEPVPGGFRVVDLGSTNGTWADGTPITGPVVIPEGATVTLGRAVIRLHRCPPEPHPAPDPPVAPPGPVRVTAGGPPPAPPTPPGPIALATSAAAGLAMGLVLHSWSAASLALLGPAVLLANAADAARRHRRARRRHRAERQQAARDLASTLTEHAAAARSELEHRHPGPGGAARPTDPRPAPGAEARVPVRLGTGDIPWTPPVPPGLHLDPDLEAVIEGHRTLPGAPLVIDLADPGPIALAGPRHLVEAVARSLLVQARPDPSRGLAIAVLTVPERAERWDWCRWLPHTRDPRHGTLLAATAAERRRVLDALGAAAGPVVAVVDAPEAATRLLDSPEPGVVPLLLGGPPDHPTVSRRIRIHADGSCTTHIDGARVTGRVAGIALDVAGHLARGSTAGGPADGGIGVPLPHRVALVDLHPGGGLGTDAIRARWIRSGPGPAARAVVGVGTDGPFTVDLDAHGPHLLIAGTTGAGKSELLRTLVASLAMSAPPDELAFVLVDFKGGSAFDACADLPHTVGLVTDLDEHLADRVLRSLTAELRGRELDLRALGVDSLADAHRLDRPAGVVPPRLVVVVDEFATLAAEVPGFVDALVGLAQRGRSLGMHLVLATQRPGGVVSEAIRANIGGRIALRTADEADSREVLGSPDAAHLPRAHPGRALLQVGTGPPIPLQIASVSLVTPSGAARPRVEVVPLEMRRTDPPPPTGDRAGAIDLRRIADALGEAWRAGGGRPPRPIWCRPLPEDLAWPVDTDRSIAGPAAALSLGVADDPDRQCRRWAGWDPELGPLLVLGRPGQGTSTTLATTTLAACQRWSTPELHVHVIDGPDHRLHPLAGLPQVGAVIAADDVERQRRLVRDLMADLAERRRTPAGSRTDLPKRLIVVDGWSTFQGRWSRDLGDETWQGMVGILGGGTPHGIHVAVAADTIAGLGGGVLGACVQRIVFALGDDTDRRLAGATSTSWRPRPGRATALPGGLEVQIARPRQGLVSAVARLAGAHDPATPGTTRPGGPQDSGPRPIRRLPTSVIWSAPLAEAAGARCEADGTLVLAVGVADRDLRPAALTLPPGAHALIAGPSRSGRTSALRCLAQGAAALGIRVVALTAHGHTWAVDAVATDGAGTVATLRPDDPEVVKAIEGDGQLLVLVDDASGPSPLLEHLAHQRRPDRHLVIAGRSDLLRSCYESWLREVRADRASLLLDPDPDLDGDLLGSRLPRRTDEPTGAGRAWLSDSTGHGVIQVARPPG